MKTDDCFCISDTLQRILARRSTRADSVMLAFAEDAANFMFALLLAILQQRMILLIIVLLHILHAGR